MPQMMPYKWSMIFMLSISLMMFLMNFNYFIYLPSLNTFKKKISSSKWLMKW